MTAVKAVAFDLLTGLLDSWTLWNRVAGSAALGRTWRLAYLARTYEAGAYVPYESLVLHAAADAGVPAAAAERIMSEWDTLEPWPDAVPVLERLAAVAPLAIVTNCSNALAARAVARLGNVSFATCVAAEAVGAYKPDPRTYRQMLAALGATAADTLFVAGSPFDVAGAARVGMRVYWHNRAGLVAADRDSWPAGAEVAEERTLAPLVDYVQRSS